MTYQTKFQPHHNILFLRHAQSQFNLACIQFAQKYQIQLEWNELCKNQEFKKQVNYNQKYMDPPITQQGKQQCQKVRNITKDHQFDAVIVSPHLRTLQTCQEVFGDTNIHIIVDPIVSQVFRYSCDVSSNTNQKKIKFPNFDFSEMDKYGQLWYISLLPQEQRQLCMKKIQQVDAKDFQHKQKIVLQMLHEAHLYEDPQNLRNRCRMVRKRLIEYSKKYKKIAVVSHYYAILYILAQKFDQNHLPFIANILNCHPYWSSFQHLSKFTDL